MNTRIRTIGTDGSVSRAYGTLGKGMHGKGMHAAGRVAGRPVRPQAADWAGRVGCRIPGDLFRWGTRPFCSIGPSRS
jgi:hypothetical protein